MKKQGWLWTEEFIWHKKNSYPGKWPNRFRDSWERLLQFNKEKNFNMYQEAVMVPMGDWAKTRLRNLSETDMTRDESKVDSGFGKNISNWINRGKAFPTNVLHLATECNNKNHSAAFPEELPAWIEKLESLNLSEVIRKKNPYLFKAKNVIKTQDIVQAIVDAFLSSSEEGIFGNWLEGLAIFINQKVYNGRKSGIPGIDLEFEKDSIRFIVSIKSGPAWANGSQITKLIDNFNSARKTLHTSGAKINIIAVNGCCYGRTTKRNKYKEKGDYYKLCGQAFWEFISGDPELYKTIIEPLGHNAKNKNDDFLKSYAQKINLFTKEFAIQFCKNSGEIDWDKLIEFNSKQNDRFSML